MRPTLRTQMLLVVLVPLILVASALGLFMTYRYSADVGAAHAARSEALASQMRTSAEFALFVGDYPQLDRMAQNLLANDPRVRQVTVFDRHGVAQVSASRTPEPADSGQTSTLALSVRVAPAELDPYVTQVALQPDATALGSIEIVYDDSAQAASRQRLLLIAGLATLLAVILGSALAAALTRTITAPVAEITAAVARISSGDLKARAPQSGSVALGELAEGINAMAQNLEMAQNVLRWRIAEATAEMRSQRDAAERATSAKSRFLAAASHDLRQPLQAMALFVFRLRHTLGDDAIQPLVRQLETAVAALQSLLGSLLDLSQIDAGAVKPAPDHLRVAHLLQTSAEHLQPLAEERGLQLRLRVAPLADAIYADRQMLARIVANLVSNAIKYTRRGRVLITARRCGDRVRLAVWDTGIGIAAEQQEAVFQEFRQIGNEERNPEQGLGIGLSICRELARAMGSEIQVRSRPGRGSVFWLDLPHGGEADKPVEVLSKASTSPSAEMAPVLLAVFDPVLRARLATQLETWGIRSVGEISAGVVSAALCDADALGGPAGEALAQQLGACLTPGQELRVIVIGDAAPALRRDSAWRWLRVIPLSPQAPPGRLRAALLA